MSAHLILFLIPAVLAFNAKRSTDNCCPILNSSVIGKSRPVKNNEGDELSNCAVLRRIGSECGNEGFILCEALDLVTADHTFVQLFDEKGAKVEEMKDSGRVAGIKIQCDRSSGKWKESTRQFTIQRAACGITPVEGNELFQLE